MNRYEEIDPQQIVAIVALSKSVPDACEQIRRRTGIEMTPKSLQKYLSRRGFGSPSAVMMRAKMGRPEVPDFPAMPVFREPAPQPKAEPVPVADRTWVDQSQLLKFAAPKAGVTKWLGIPDVHAPFQSRRGWACMMAAARAWRPDAIVITGDFPDFYSVSFHDRSPSRPSRLAEEIGETNALLDDLDSLGAKTRIYIAGNHENRLDRYIARNAPALAGLPGLTTPELLRLGQRGWRYLPFMSTYQAGDCVFTHTITKFGGVNSHRQTRDAFNATTVSGHTHRLSYENRGDFFGGNRTGMTHGCLFDLLTVDYEHVAKARSVWTNGFSVGLLDHRRERMHLTPVAIVDGSCSFGGQILEAAA